MTTFTFHIDPGHGWLEVSSGDLAALGLTKRAFSSYSYIENGSMFLEEDCDAPIFIRAYKEKNGSRPGIVDSFKENTPIRNLPHNLA